MPIRTILNTLGFVLMLSGLAGFLTHALIVCPLMERRYHIRGDCANYDKWLLDKGVSGYILKTTVLSMICGAALMCAVG